MKEKFVLITGASSGIGRQISITLSENYNVILCGRTKEKLEQTQKLCSTKNKSILWILDLINLSEIESELIWFINKHEINIEHFVHCAGFMKMQPLKLISEDALIKTFNTNIFSASFILKELVKKKVNESSLKTVVFISSNINGRGARAMSLYAASKGALDSLMQSLAIELAPKVRVNSVLPGGIETEMTKHIYANPKIAERLEKAYPLGKGNTLDIANAVEFLISPKSRWITGQQIVVDGGRTTNISE